MTYSEQHRQSAQGKQVSESVRREQAPDAGAATVASPRMPSMPAQATPSTGRRGRRETASGTGEGCGERPITRPDTRSPSPSRSPLRQGDDQGRREQPRLRDSPWTVHVRLPPAEGHRARNDPRCVRWAGGGTTDPPQRVRCRIEGGRRQRVRALAGVRRAPSSACPHR
jgi:hypothetical protein